jgi:sporulation protein YlmC with PRC-barrel domain
MEELIGMPIGASDGEIGKIKDIYFDDHRWVVRYLVVETGGWFEDRKVLVSPFAVTGIDWDLRTVQVNLTRQQVRQSPSFDTDKPVSRQHEIEFYGYYGYPYYWGGPLLWGVSLYPLMPAGPIPHVNQAQPGHAEAPADWRLRSASEVTGYRIKATDDLIGHLENFLIDGESWAIRYLIVDTRNWWPGKHVVIPPQWIKRLDWEENCVHVDVTRNTVQHAPEYEPALEFSRANEASLYQYYQRPVYWE